jgi:hypothetical protein
MALEQLSEKRDPRLLAQLRRQALAPLMEMARWKSAGHAEPARKILGRLRTTKATKAEKDRKITKDTKK